MASRQLMTRDGKPEGRSSDQGPRLRSVLTVPARLMACADMTCSEAFYRGHLISDTRGDSVAKTRRWLFLGTTTLGPCGIIATPIYNVHTSPPSNRAVTPSTPQTPHSRGADNKDTDSPLQPDRGFMTRGFHSIPATWHCRGGYRCVEGSSSEQLILAGPCQS